MVVGATLRKPLLQRAELKPDSEVLGGTPDTNAVEGGERDCQVLSFLLLWLSQLLIS